MESLAQPAVKLKLPPEVNCNGTLMKRNTLVGVIYWVFDKHRQIITTGTMKLSRICWRI